MEIEMCGETTAFGKRSISRSLAERIRSYRRAAEAAPCKHCGRRLGERSMTWCVTRQSPAAHWIHEDCKGAYLLRQRAAWQNATRATRAAARPAAKLNAGQVRLAEARRRLAAARRRHL